MSHGDGSVTELFVSDLWRIPTVKTRPVTRCLSTGVGVPCKTSLYVSCLPFYPSHTPVIGYHRSHVEGFNT